MTPFWLLRESKWACLLQNVPGTSEEPPGLGRAKPETQGETWGQKDSTTFLELVTWGDIKEPGQGHPSSMSGPQKGVSWGEVVFSDSGRREKEEMSSETEKWKYRSVAARHNKGETLSGRRATCISSHRDRRMSPLLMEALRSRTCGSLKGCRLSWQNSWVTRIFVFVWQISNR